MLRRIEKQVLYYARLILYLPRLLPLVPYPQRIKHLNSAAPLVAWHLIHRNDLILLYRGQTAEQADLKDQSQLLSLKPVILPRASPPLRGLLLEGRLAASAPSTVSLSQNLRSTTLTKLKL